MFRGTPDHAGVYPDKGPRNLKTVKWRFKTQGKVRSTPAVTGALRWKVQTGGDLSSSPTLLEPVIFRMSRGSIKRMPVEDYRDHTGYRDKEWLDSDYGYPTRLDPFKTAVGAIVGWTGSRIYRPRDQEA